jgi:hypothetical protein
LKKEKVREKGFLIAKIPSIKGFLPKRPETTTTCGPVNPIHQGIPTKKRPETTTSCGPVNPIHEGIPPKICTKMLRK